VINLKHAESEGQQQGIGESTTSPEEGKTGRAREEDKATPGFLQIESSEAHAGQR